MKKVTPTLIIWLALSVAIICNAADTKTKTYSVEIYKGEVKNTLSVLIPVEVDLPEAVSASIPFGPKCVLFTYFNNKGIPEAGLVIRNSNATAVALWVGDPINKYWLYIAGIPQECSADEQEEFIRQANELTPI